MCLLTYEACVNKEVVLSQLAHLWATGAAPGMAGSCMSWLGLRCTHIPAGIGNSIHPRG